MSIREGWIVVVAILFFLVGFLIGGGVIHDAIKGDCDEAGVVTFGHVAYKCSAQGKSENHK